MSIKITNECINCGACAPECPNHAIYEGSEEWSLSEGTNIKGIVKISSGLLIDAESSQTPDKRDIYFIVRDKCTECVGFYDEPQCMAVCPVDCCVLDEKNVESKKSLLHKKKFLHGEPPI